MNREASPKGRVLVAGILTLVAALGMVFVLVQGPSDHVTPSVESQGEALPRGIPGPGGAPRETERGSGDVPSPGAATPATLEGHPEEQPEATAWPLRVRVVQDATGDPVPLARVVVLVQVFEVLRDDPWSGPTPRVTALSGDDGQCTLHLPEDVWWVAVSASSRDGSTCEAVVLSRPTGPNPQPITEVRLRRPRRTVRVRVVSLEPDQSLATSAIRVSLSPGPDLKGAPTQWGMTNAAGDWEARTFADSVIARATYGDGSHASSWRELEGPETTIELRILGTQHEVPLRVMLPKSEPLPLRLVFNTSGARATSGTRARISPGTDLGIRVRVTEKPDLAMLLLTAPDPSYELGVMWLHGKPVARDLTLDLGRWYRGSVRLVDATGSPLPCAHVTLEAAMPFLGGSLSLGLTAHDQGALRGAWPPGAYAVTADGISLGVHHFDESDTGMQRRALEAPTCSGMDVELNPSLAGLLERPVLLALRVPASQQREGVLKTHRLQLTGMSTKVLVPWPHGTELEVRLERARGKPLTHHPQSYTLGPEALRFGAVQRERDEVVHVTIAGWSAPASGQQSYLWLRDTSVFPAPTSQRPFSYEAAVANGRATLRGIRHGTYEVWLCTEAKQPIRMITPTPAGAPPTHAARLGGKLVYAGGAISIERVLR